MNTSNNWNSSFNEHYREDEKKMDSEEITSYYQEYVDTTETCISCVFEPLWDTIKITNSLLLYVKQYTFIIKNSIPITDINHKIAKENILDHLIHHTSLPAGETLKKAVEDFFEVLEKELKK